MFYPMNKTEKALYRVSQLIAVFSTLMFFNVPGALFGVALFILGTLVACGHIKDPRPAQAVGNVALAFEVIFGMLTAFSLCFVLWEYMNTEAFFFTSSISWVNRFGGFVIFGIFVGLEAIKIVLMTEFLSELKSVELDQQKCVPAPKKPVFEPEENDEYEVVLSYPDADSDADSDGGDFE